jgi:hypothetical protein
MFWFLKDQVWQRIQGWKEKFLSNIRKEVMIKAVIRTGSDRTLNRWGHWFTGPIVKNRLNRRFDSFRPDELNCRQYFSRKLEWLIIWSNLRLTLLVVLVQIKWST